MPVLKKAITKRIEQLLKKVSDNGGDNEDETEDRELYINILAQLYFENGDSYSSYVVAHQLAVKKYDEARLNILDLTDMLGISLSKKKKIPIINKTMFSDYISDSICSLLEGVRRYKYSWEREQDIVLILADLFTMLHRYDIPDRLPSEEKLRDKCMKIAIGRFQDAKYEYSGGF
jgi:hypothetical protein